MTFEFTLEGRCLLSYGKVKMARTLGIPLAVALCLTLPARSDVYSTFSFEEWQDMVEDFTTITFTDYPDGTPINDQYEELGVMFTGPSFTFASNGLVNDGWGLHGPSGLHLYFDEPQSWIAIHHAANAYFALYAGGELIGTSDFDPVAGVGSILGIVSSKPFDEVIITKPAIYGSHILIDDLHWGAPVPAPGAITLIGIACLTSHRRRRR